MNMYGGITEIKKEDKCEVDIQVGEKGRVTRREKREDVLKEERAGREWANGRSLGRGTFRVPLYTTGTNPSYYSHISTYVYNLP